MEEIKTKGQNTSKFKIGGYLLLSNAIFLIFLGISSIFGFTVPAINLKGTLRSSLNGWLIYSLINFLDLLGELISFFRWHNLLDIINILLIFTVNILYFIGGGISFQRKNKIGLFSAILFIISLILIITDIFIENLIFQLPFPSEPNIILYIIDTNIMIIISLGFLGGYFSYFKE